MEIASTTDSKVAPLQQSSQNSCSNDEDLIDSVQARNLAISNVQLGNKLAKPCIVEQSPSAGFVYGRVSTVGAVKRRIISELKVGNSHGPTPDKDPSKLVESDAQLLSKARSKSSQRILNLSASNNGPNSTSHGLDHGTDIPYPGNGEQITHQPQSQPQEKQNVSLPQPSRHQGLQALTNNFDIPTLSKILAFTYQKETNQKNQLINRLKSDLNNKEDGLAHVLRMQKDFETQLEKAYHSIENLQERIEILEQQQEEVTQDDAQHVNVLHYLKTFDRKLNLLIKERLLQEGQQDDLSQTRKYMKQIAEDDHQQNRHQMRGSRPLQKAGGNSAIDEQCHTAVKEKIEHIAESQELPYIGESRHDFVDSLLEELPGSSKTQAGKPEENLKTNMEESQELHCVGKERLNLDCSQNDESKSLEEIQQPSTPVATSQHNQATEIDSCQGSHNTNKFQTRKRTSTQSESGGSMDDRRFKKPVNHISKLALGKLESNKEIKRTARDVDDKLPKETKPLAERDINTLQIHPSRKNKGLRGQGGG